MARNFDKNNPDRLDFGNPSYLDLSGDEITVSLWVCNGMSGSERKPFAKWADTGLEHSWLLSINPSGVPFFAVVAGGVLKIANATTDLDADSEWHHLCGVYDGSTIRMYVDGVQEGTVGAGANIASQTAPVRIGSGGPGGEQPYDGKLGHAAIWDVGLSAGAVASLAAGVSPLRMRRDDLLFYAPVNGQSPEPDVVGGASGTITGTPTVIEEPHIPQSIVAPA